MIIKETIPEIDDDFNIGVEEDDDDVWGTSCSSAHLGRMQLETLVNKSKQLL